MAKTVSSTNGAGKAGQLHAKKKKKGIGSFFHNTHKDKLQRDLRPKQRLDTSQLLEKNRTSSEMDCNSIFFNPSLRIMEIKTKIF